MSGPKQLPLYHVMSGDLECVAPFVFVQTPSGSRASIGFTGGTFRDSKGEQIGTLLTGQGGQYGSIDSNGILHEKTVFTVHLSDGKHAIMNGLGKAKMGEWDYIYPEFQTDSEKFGYLNSLFMVGSSKMEGNKLTSDVWSPTQL